MIGGPLGHFKQDDLIREHGLLKVRDFMHDADPFHEAETAAQIEKRIKQAVGHLQDELEDGDQAIVVSHGTYLRNLATIYTEGHPTSDNPKMAELQFLTLQIPLK